MYEYFGLFCQNIWNDDCGAVLTTEYMILGTLVVAGSVAGLSAVRDATVAEMNEFGNSLHSIRQTYGLHRPQATQSASTPGFGEPRFYQPNQGSVPHASGFVSP
jgi:hypothetical protein